MGSLNLPPSMTVLKWLGFVSAVWVQAISGNNYTFSNYSDALKSLMNLTQLQLNNLSVAKDVGKAFGLLAGMASDRFPTWVILLIGSVEGLVGYGAQWLVMCIFLCMGGNSTTWMNTAVLVTCIRNFRKNRGPVSGILKGYVGLSTAIFTDLCFALFSSDPSSFLLMLSLVPFAVCLFAMFFLREIPTQITITAADTQQESNYFSVFNVLAVVVAVYLLCFDFIKNSGRLISQLYSMGLLILLGSPLIIPIYSFFKSWNSIRSRLDLEEPLVKEEAVTGAVKEETGEIAMIEQRAPVIGEEHTIFEAVRTIDFWVLFVSFLCGVGTGLAVMNNMGQIGLALGYADVSMFVSLTSIWGFFGRILSGTLSEHFLKKAGTPRPLWNAASQILMTVGYVLMAMAMPGSLYIGSVIVGICYGVRLSITVPTASELFGLKYYGLIYNILILNLPIGSFLFSGLLAGFLYDMEATPTEGGGNTCIGGHCYRIVFLVMALACVIGFVLDIWLAFRTKELYSKLKAANKRSTKKVNNNNNS
ncbi:protein NUCLEAR FUSION DEFECTIVE 4 [Cucumis melo var. makuwa]|uniref:Protein NUCLEAR FUSION DEFECTIVE 4 n=2 Tax=Cucumis melo var. makuwa TaxID=1194695 RepID=A0A5A7TQ90_CUCMM|nr:protein NUCLEAR FUSION DEFECTIVE 4 [Cucumis melo var. makuwa]